MTTYGYFINLLIAKGLFPTYAKEIIELAIIFIRDKGDYKVTWRRNKNEYPKNMLNAIYSVYIQPIALKWINENKPNVWCKASFVML